MDNLTHAFTAIACTHTVSRERPSGLTLAAAVLAANVQDLDWLPVLSLRPESIEAHRGTMHSLLAMPLLAIGTALGARFVARRPRRSFPCWGSAWWRRRPICSSTSSTRMGSGRCCHSTYRGYLRVVAEPSACCTVSR